MTKKIGEAYVEWWRGARPGTENGLLFEMALRYENLFGDLSLESRAVCRALFRYQMQNDAGEWCDCERSTDGAFFLDTWMYKFRRLRELEGLCKSKERTIYIKRGLVGKELRTTLLHEMIHAYEGQLPCRFREWLILHLYRRVAKRITVKRLDQYINLSTHIDIHQAAHGVLFLLKSLDLDLRFGWEPGDCICLRSRRDVSATKERRHVMSQTINIYEMTPAERQQLVDDLVEGWAHPPGSPRGVGCRACDAR
jgi:hypothetical protein